MMIDEKTVSIPIEDAIKEFREAEPDIGEAYINITAKRLIRQKITGRIVDIIDAAPESENA